MRRCARWRSSGPVRWAAWRPVARCIELGADDFLHKPVDPWLLKARVDSSLARKQQRDQQTQALRRLMPGGPAQASRLGDACVLVVGLDASGLLSEAPAQTLELLNNWSTLMLDAVAGRGGEVAQFRGDGLMALFGEPQAALGAARDMADVVASFNDERRVADQPPVRIGVGIARGEVVVATVATAQRASYACLGAPVQRAEHLAAACRRDGHSLLMDADTRAGLPADTPTVAVEQGVAYRPGAAP